MQICMNKTIINYTAFYLISILCFVSFVEDGIDKKHSSGISFRKKLNHSILVNEVLVVNAHQSHIQLDYYARLKLVPSLHNTVWAKFYCFHST